jgi:hypothetical protein
MRVIIAIVVAVIAWCHEACYGRALPNVSRVPDATVEVVLHVTRSVAVATDLTLLDGSLVDAAIEAGRRGDFADRNESALHASVRLLEDREERAVVFEWSDRAPAIYAGSDVIGWIQVQDVGPWLQIDLTNRQPRIDEAGVSLGSLAVTTPEWMRRPRVGSHVEGDYRVERFAVNGNQYTASALDSSGRIVAIESRVSEQVRLRRFYLGDKWLGELRFPEQAVSIYGSDGEFAIDIWDVIDVRTIEAKPTHVVSMSSDVVVVDNRSSQPGQWQISRSDSPLTVNQVFELAKARSPSYELLPDSRASSGTWGWTVGSLLVAIIAAVVFFRHRWLTRHVN